MEKLQDPINPCLIGEDFDVGWLEEYVNNIGSNYKFEDLYSEDHSLPNLEDKMPFLQMLQGVEPSQPALPFMQEPNYFQLLLSIQHQKMIINNTIPNFTTNHIKSETFREEQTQVSPPKCNPNDEIKKPQGRSKRQQLAKTPTSRNNVGGVTIAAPREKRKRKRPIKVTKNEEEVETQRRTHIAVERNRRRQMNDHLTALRSLMPNSYVQRGDQASIIGGAIDFVKEMEQLLQSLQAQRRMRQSEENTDISATSSSTNFNDNMFLTSPTTPFQFRNFSPNEEGNGHPTEVKRTTNNEEFTAENRSDLADIKVVVIQNHVNLKIQCQRRPGQLLKAIVAFEELRLTILHLNITSLHSLVHYSFNLKIEEDCKLGSADEVVRAVHHIFSLINIS